MVRLQATASLAVPKPEEPKKLAAAASDFEALLLTQMLRSARESSASSLDGSSGSGDAVMDFAEQQFGALMAAAGGIGLGKLAVSGLAREQTGAQNVQLK